MRRSTLTVLITVLVAAAAAASAGSSVSAERLADAAQKNAAALRQYSWKMQMEMTADDAVQPAKVYHVRYDDHGNLQQTLLTKQEPNKAAWYAIRGRIKKKRERELGEWSVRLAEQIKRYTTPTRGQMLDFYGKAKTSKTADGAIRYTALGFLEPDDTATFWIDAASGQVDRFGFMTMLDGLKVLGEVEYGRLDDGTRYAENITVEVPEKRVRAVVETFDYIRQ